MVPREEIFGSKKSREVKFSFREEKSREKKVKISVSFSELKEGSVKKVSRERFLESKMRF